MKTLLVLANHPELPEAIRAALSREPYRILHRVSAEEAEPLLVHGMADACILDLDPLGVQGIWLIEKIRRHAPGIPMILFSGAKNWDWEEEAYLQGVNHVLAKPVRPRMLTALLERLWQSPAGAPTAPAPPPPAPAAPPAAESAGVPPAAAPQTLAVLRNFSAILTHSLNAEGMLKQFLLQLREILSVNRAAIFLRPAQAAFGTGSVPENRRLRAASAVGIASGLLQHFELNQDSGIGGQVSRTGRILRRTSEEARHDIEAQQEFELLGVQVAIPVLDRETVIGVAVFDGRVTGEPLVNSELELIFHLLEQLGLAIRNIWLHDQLAGNHQLLADILRELSSACVVVSRDLTILHANKTARRTLLRADRRGAELEFTDLPQVLGSKVYQVLKTGCAVTSIRYEPEDAPGTAFSVSVVPFQRDASGLPGSALLMMEDLSQSEQLRRLEVEAANLRLVKTMADRLTHEIGNAMVPLSVHQQLLADRWRDPDFRLTLDNALAEGVKRVNRLINQMRFLARDSLAAEDSFPLAPLLEEAYQDACKFQPAKASQLRCDSNAATVTLTGDRAALKQALTEVMLNALQANPAEPKVTVHLKAEANGQGLPAVQIEIQDNGPGFTPEAASQADRPFFTQRDVGLGLGLTVCRRILETHRGRLEIVPSAAGQSGLVRIHLPLSPAVTVKPA